MQQKPKPLTDTFFNWKELSISIVQGLVITVGILFTYQYAIFNGSSEAITRTMTFTVLIASNIFLTLINRSFYYSIFTTIRYKNNMVLFIVLITLTLVAFMLYIKPLTLFFDFETLSLLQLVTCIVIGFVSVIWFEIVKIFKRRKKNIFLN
jgi:Ca2+-transporting ATPase